ncbi:hypothetical protein BH09SUM1_BH09SUM1_12730 [soil metagenome]
MIEILLITAAIGAAAFGAAWLLTSASISLAHSRKILADVNDRSSHVAPTPRLGGIGLTAGLFLGFAFCAFQILNASWLPNPVRLILIKHDGGEFYQPLTMTALGGFALAVGLAFLLGLWDDLANPPALLKLAGQVIIALSAPLLGMRFEHYRLPGMVGYAPLALPIAVALTTAWILLVMNAVNFMDGINGLAGRFAQVTAVATFLACFNTVGWESMMPLTAALAGAATGFLPFNSPTAKAFLGDCGSQPLGVFVALIGVQLTNLPTALADGSLSPPPFIGFVIIISLFLFDVLFTIIKRLLEGKNILHAHREHLYQRYLIAVGGDHTRTLSFVDYTLWITGILGFLLIRFCFSPASTFGKSILTGLAIGALVKYYLDVKNLEGRSPTA